MHILSIQSHVSYGQVGNAAVALPLQRRGHTVWPVPTVVLSNHAGYPDVGGQAIPASVLADIIDALDRRGALARCDAVLSGYLGSAAAGDVVLDAVRRVRAGAGGALYVCDPVIGDDGAVYVDAGLADLFRERVAPVADVLTPNLFELEQLADIAPNTLSGAPLADIVATARALLQPPRLTSVVLVTSVLHAALAPTEIALLAVNAAAAWLVTTPIIAFATPPHGGGDCCAALFTAALLEGCEPADALSQTASALYALLDITARADQAELALVAAQDAMVTPPRAFHAESVG